MLVATRDKSLVNKLKAQLSSEFDMKDLGPAKKILGVEINRDRQVENLFCHKRSMLLRCLTNLECEIAKLLILQLPPTSSCHQISVQKSDEDKRHISHVPNSNAIGSLMYVIVCIRPDLAYAVSIISRFMHNSGKAHWEAVQWILRYLKGSIDLGLVFDQNIADPGGAVGYVDVDYSGDLDQRRSLSAYIFILCGSAISWFLHFKPLRLCPPLK